VELDFSARKGGLYFLFADGSLRLEADCRATEQKKTQHTAGLFLDPLGTLLHELQQDAAVLYEERYENERQNG